MYFFYFLSTGWIFKHQIKYTAERDKERDREGDRDFSFPRNFCALQNRSKTFFLVLHHDDVACFQ